MGPTCNVLLVSAPSRLSDMMFSLPLQLLVSTTVGSTGEKASQSTAVFHPLPLPLFSPLRLLLLTQLAIFLSASSDFNPFECDRRRHNGPTFFYFVRRMYVQRDCSHCFEPDIALRYLLHTSMSYLFLQCRVCNTSCLFYAPVV